MTRRTPAPRPMDRPVSDDDDAYAYAWPCASRGAVEWNSRTATEGSEVTANSTLAPLYIQPSRVTVIRGELVIFCSR